MNQKIIGRKLNAGLIIAAVLLSLTTVVNSFLNVFNLIKDICRLIEYNYGFNFSTVTTYFSNGIFIFLSFVANALFIIYIFTGYRKAKDTMGILHFVILIVSSLFNFIINTVDLFGPVTAFITGNDNEWIIGSILSNFYSVFSSFILIICYIVSIISLKKNKKILLLTVSLILLIMPIFNRVPYAIINSIFYKIPLLENLLASIPTLLLSLIASLPLVIFSISAFSIKNNIFAPIDENIQYYNNYSSETAPVYENQYSINEETPQNFETEATVQYREEKADEIEDYILNEPVVDQRSAVLEQLSLLTKQYEAGQITVDTYNSIKDELVKKL